MQMKKNSSGFTLVELLVALLITSIVISAVASLAFAFGNARDYAEKTSKQQSHIRFTTLKLSELLRHCRLVNCLSGETIVIWREDDNGDDKININELVFINRGAERNYIQLDEYSDASIVDFGEVVVPNPVWTKSSVTLIGNCTNVEYNLDSAPPDAEMVSIAFDVVEDSGIQHYQFSSRIRCKAGYLLDD
ncbi:MAG: PilW family protein [Planctomycetota bacterium]|jgi:prepilin-type N-terminal cleavage/methylation domain-containing protein